jgi:RNA polymerase sigma-70 factor (ECF subfamily)
MPDGTDDSTRVEAARRGDESAWEELYRSLYPRLRAFLARRVGAGDAEEAVSETMSRAVAGIQRYRAEAAGFDGWVFGIARHVAADYGRKAARRRSPVPAHAAGGGVVALPDEPAELVIAAGEEEELRRAFARLDPRDQEVLELRVVAGLSAEQVAAALGKRPGAVRMAQSRALAHLRSLMGETGG